MLTNHINVQMIELRENHIRVLFLSLLLSLGLLSSRLLCESSSTLAAMVPVLMLGHESAWTAIVALELVLIHLTSRVNLVIFQRGQLDLLMLMRLLFRSGESLLLLLFGTTQ